MDDVNRILQNNWNNTFSQLTSYQGGGGGADSRDAPNNPIDNISMTVRYNTAVDTRYREVKESNLNNKQKQQSNKRRKIIRDDDDQGNDSSSVSNSGSDRQQTSSYGSKRRGGFGEDDEAEENNDIDEEENNGGGNIGIGGIVGGGICGSSTSMSFGGGGGRGRGRGRGNNNEGGGGSENGEGRGNGRTRKPKVIHFGYVPVKELLHPYQRKIQDDGGDEGEDCYSSCDELTLEENSHYNSSNRNEEDYESCSEGQEKRPNSKEKRVYTPAEYQQHLKNLLFQSDSECSDLMAMEADSPQQSMACGSEEERMAAAAATNRTGGCTIDSALAVPGSDKIFGTQKRAKASFYNDSLRRKGGGYGSDCSTGSSGSSNSSRSSNSERIKKRECFGCMYGNRKMDGIKVNNINLLIKLMEENIGKLNYYSLARMAHLFFKHSIYIPMKNEGLKINMWRTHDIYIHLKYHIMDPKFFIWNTIAELSDRLTVLNDMCFKLASMEDGNKVLIADEKVMRMCADTQKRIVDTYKLNPKSMNFYNEQSGINLETLGKLINTSKDWRFGD